MGFCQPCMDVALKSGDYVGSEDEKIVPALDCMIHPTLDNWRFWHMMKTVQYWGTQPTGFQDRRNPTPITLGQGWVHQRNAELILFDYEKYFVALAIDKKLLEQQGPALYDTGQRVDRAIRLTDKGNEMLHEHVKNA